METCNQQPARQDARVVAHSRLAHGYDAPAEEQGGDHDPAAVPFDHHCLHGFEEDEGHVDQGHHYAVLFADEAEVFVHAVSLPKQTNVLVDLVER